ncbi:ER degradation-enhancing alpha-mannosidase-like protein 2, partial [Gonapodya sp. JEL0774]
MAHQTSMNVGEGDILGEQTKEDSGEGESAKAEDGAQPSDQTPGEPREAELNVGRSENMTGKASGENKEVTGARTRDRFRQQEVRGLFSWLLRAAQLFLRLLWQLTLFAIMAITVLPSTDPMRLAVDAVTKTVIDRSRAQLLRFLEFDPVVTPALTPADIIDNWDPGSGEGLGAGTATESDRFRYSRWQSWLTVGSAFAKSTSSFSYDNDATDDEGDPNTASSLYRLANPQTSESDVTPAYARLFSLTRKRQRQIRAELATLSTSTNFFRPGTSAHFHLNRLRVLSMLLHSLHGYLAHAYPRDSLRPISCDGIDDFGGMAITLLDSLDTLHIVGEHELFAAAVDLVRETDQVDFRPIMSNATDSESLSRRARLDVNVSVFETTIRAVGGLAAAHFIALEPPYSTAIGGLTAQRKVPSSKTTNWRASAKDPLLPTYSTSPHLLHSSHHLTRRILPAFQTPRLLPYGTVNLLRGVADGETASVCAACVGTAALEWRAVGVATGDREVEEAPILSLLSLLHQRSPLGLLGGHINLTSGSWIHEIATTGPDSDSAYEYACKLGWVWADVEDESAVTKGCGEMYTAIRNHLKHGPLHLDIQMANGAIATPFFHSLGLFLPGLKVLRGDLLEAQDELMAARGVMERVAMANAEEIKRRARQRAARSGGSLWRSPHHTGGLPLLPEQFDLRHNGSLVTGRSRYPLRPEFWESAWLLYTATKDTDILRWAAEY